MSILSLEAVSKNFGIKPLLEDVTFSQEIDEKIGVIGPNGSGKSTLLRLIAGVEPSDSGRLTVQKTIHLAYLPQNPVFEPGHTVLDAVFVQDNDATRRLHDYEAACRALEKTGGRDEALQRRVADLSHQLDVTGGWDLEVNARAILDKLGITDTDATVETLSGGQRKRVALARALILQPDLLILDEPTNHLDADTIAWLEDRLARYTRALLLVTHDRYFLDRITNTMLEIEHRRTHRFEGNYTRYLEMKAERDVQREAEAQKKAGLIRHELAWLRRGAKARTSKQKARIDRAHALMEQPDEKSAAPLKLASPTQRLGKKVIEVRNVSKSYDGLPLLSDFSFSFTRGGRIGIIGPNGTGKTTFLDILAGRTNPDAGAVEIGQTVAIGYYDQESAALKEDLRVIDYVKEMAEIIKTADGSIITASQMLERFLFPPAVQYTLVGSLSGGERRRLYLLRLLMGAPNVLLLDEPTNDFDIDTLMALEDYLDAFDGCLVTVSHDRYFLDRTVDHLIRFDENGQQRIYPGNYAAFLEIDARETEDLAAQVKPDSESTEQRPAAASHPAPASKSEAPRKLSYKEKRELELLEGRIMEAEERKAVIEADLVETATDFERANDLYEELKELNDRVEADIDRWGELMDRV